MASRADGPSSSERLVDNSYLIRLLPVCRLLPANSLNHTPKNSIREVFFYSVGFFSSAGGGLFPTQIFEDQCWRGRARRAGFFLFYFLSPRIRSKTIGPRAPPNSSCDDICSVLASHSNDVRPNKPYIEPLTLVTP